MRYRMKKHSKPISNKHSELNNNKLLPENKVRFIYSKIYVLIVIVISKFSNFTTTFKDLLATYLL